MASPNRGEVWLIDLGYVAKIRPCAIMSDAPETPERAIVAIVPHTTSVRGTRYEIPIPKSFLKSGAFDAQGLQSAPTVRLIRKLGEMDQAEMKLLGDTVKEWLGLD